MARFSEVFDDVTKEGHKIPKENYLSEGLYPIIDQGQEYIAGYSNDDFKLYCNVPAIIFGDHTRVIKYVDIPCFLGADGVKLLRAKNPNVNCKYLYYALCNAKIPNTGYNRHFKWLKEIDIPIVSVQEQEHIVSLLDKINNLIALRKQQLDKLEELVKARFVEMFGDPVINPMKWPLVSLLEMGDCKNGMNFHDGDSGIQICCLGVGDFKNLSTIYDTSKLSKISLNQMPSDDYILMDGDILFVRSNGNKSLVGRCLAVYPGETVTTFSGFCIRYRRHNDTVQTEYLLQVLKSNSVRDKIAGRGANIQNLNQQILATLNIPLPPKELQSEFGYFVKRIEKWHLTIQQGLNKMEVMKKALMQTYFE